MCVFLLIDVKCHTAITERKKASILADYSFYSTSKVNSLYQFIDCTDVNGRDLARDIRAGVIPINHSKVVIALGNVAQLDKYTNVAVVVSGVVNALVERYGSINLEMVVLGILPRLYITQEQVEILKDQNRALFKVVRSLVRRKKLPIRYIPAYIYRRITFQPLIGKNKHTM